MVGIFASRADFVRDTQSGIFPSGNIRADLQSRLCRSSSRVTHSNRAKSVKKYVISDV